MAVIPNTSPEIEIDKILINWPDNGRRMYFSSLTRYLCSQTLIIADGTNWKDELRPNEFRNPSFRDIRGRRYIHPINGNTEPLYLLEDERYPRTSETVWRRELIIRELLEITVSKLLGPIFLIQPNPTDKSCSDLFLINSTYNLLSIEPRLLTNAEIKKTVLNTLYYATFSSYDRFNTPVAMLLPTSLRLSTNLRAKTLRLFDQFNHRGNYFGTQENQKRYILDKIIGDEIKRFMSVLNLLINGGVFNFKGPSHLDKNYIEFTEEFDAYFFLIYFLSEINSKLKEFATQTKQAFQPELIKILRSPIPRVLTDNEWDLKLARSDLTHLFNGK